MKVRLTVAIDDRERYIISKYFEAAGEPKRARATRDQVRRFVSGAVGAVVREQAAAFKRRQRSTAARLADGTPQRVAIPRTPEHQLDLFM